MILYTIADIDKTRQVLHSNSKAESAKIENRESL